MKSDAFRGQARRVLLALGGLLPFAVAGACGGSVGEGSTADGGDASNLSSDAGSEGASPLDAGSDQGFDATICMTDATFPPEAGSPFACGAATCWSGSQYCLTGEGPQQGGPPLGCMPLLACGSKCDGGVPSCSCAAYSGSGACTCSDDGGAIFVACSFP